MSFIRRFRSRCDLREWSSSYLCHVSCVFLVSCSIKRLCRHSGTVGTTRFDEDTLLRWSLYPLCPLHTNRFVGQTLSDLRMVATSRTFGSGGRHRDTARTANAQSVRNGGHMRPKAGSEVTPSMTGERNCVHKHDARKRKRDAKRSNKTKRGRRRHPVGPTSVDKPWLYSIL